MTDIEIRDLVFAYGKQRVLDGISVNIPQGKLTIILGENGSGKTTLLHCLCRLNKPADGRIKIKDRNLENYTARELAKNIALVSQQTDIVPMTTQEYLMLGRTPHRGLLSTTDTSEDKSAVDMVINRFKLDKYRDKTLSQLSGGERQLVAIARAIVQDTPIMLLDEPTANLDLRHREEIMKTLRREVAEHCKTIIIVMHDINLAVRYAEYAIMLKEGSILAQGEAGEVLNTRNLSELYQTELKMIKHEKQTLFMPLEM